MKTRRNRRSKKGGWGGWARTTAVGPNWNGTNGGNHFALSKSGVPAGDPIPVPEFWGPRMQDANRLVPTLKINALSKSGGSKRSNRSKRSDHKKRIKRSSSRSKRSSSRSKRGGFVFGGFPQDIQTGWDNLKIGTQNMYRGFMGNNQLNSASPWNQPAFNTNAPPAPQKLIDIAAIRAAANARVAKII
jgi:hypothetical protein